MAGTRSRFDAADYLRTKASIDIFLAAARRENDPAYLSYAEECSRRAAVRWKITEALPPDEVGSIPGAPPPPPLPR